MLGTISKHKGQHLAVDVIKRLQEKNSKYHTQYNWRRLHAGRPHSLNRIKKLK